MTTPTTTYPWQQLKTMMTALLPVLEQCQQDPNPPDPNAFDLGQANQVRDTLGNLILAAQQAQSGQPKGGSSGTPGTSTPGHSGTQKKSQE